MAEALGKDPDRYVYMFFPAEQQLKLFETDQVSAPLLLNNIKDRTNNADELIITVGSNRQAGYIEYMNAQSKKNGYCVENYKKLPQKFKDFGMNQPCVFRDDLLYTGFISENHKTEILLFQAKALAARYPDDTITMDFYDDIEHILQGTEETLAAHTASIPKNVTINVLKFARTEHQQPKLRQTFQGTEEIPVASTSVTPVNVGFFGRIKTRIRKLFGYSDEQSQPEASPAHVLSGQQPMSTAKKAAIGTGVVIGTGAVIAAAHKYRKNKVQERLIEDLLGIDESGNIPKEKRAGVIAALNRIANGADLPESTCDQARDLAQQVQNGETVEIQQIRALLKSTKLVSKVE